MSEGIGAVIIMILGAIAFNMGQLVAGKRKGDKQIIDGLQQRIAEYESENLNRKQSKVYLHSRLGPKNLSELIK